MNKFGLISSFQNFTKLCDHVVPNHVKQGDSLVPIVLKLQKFDCLTGFFN